MITSNMSNPITAVKPDFGMLTLKHNVNDIKSLKGLIGTFANDTVDRGQFTGDVSKELSAKELAKQFG